MPQAREADHAHGIVDEGVGRARPQAALGEVARAAEGVDQALGRPLGGARHRVDGEVAPAQVVLEGGAAQRREVDVSAGEHDAVGGEAFRDGVDGPAELVGQTGRETVDGSAHGEVDVACRQSQELVAQGPADDPHGRAALAGRRRVSAADLAQQAVGGGEHGVRREPGSLLAAAHRHGRYEPARPPT